MELDELKQTWKQTPVNNNLNTDIMDIIQHKTYGPMAAMKKVFKKQMIAMSLLPLVLFTSNLDNPHIVLTSIMFWSYVAFCMSIVAFSYQNYRIVSNMETMDGMVKTNLEQQIALLEKRRNREIAGLKITLLFFIALAEVVPYFQHYRMLDLWHSFPLLARISVYVTFMVLQNYFNKRISQRNMGVHLTYLKNLIKELS